MSAAPVDAAISRWRDALPEELFEQRVFLLWERRPKPGKPGKFDKIPYYAGGGIRHGAQGSADDRLRLVDFGDALVAFRRSRCNGIGMALLPDVPDWALDLDDCLDAQGSPSEIAQRVIASGTYCERSPSGSGVRALFSGKAGVDAKNHRAGVEIFDSRGFVTLTGDRIAGDALLACPPELLAQILAVVRPVHRHSPSAAVLPSAPPVNAELLQDVSLPPRVWRRLVAPYAQGCDRSAAALTLALQLKRNGLTQEQCLELMSIPEVLEPALERRGGDIERARAWMWRYVVMPAYRRRERAA